MPGQAKSTLNIESIDETARLRFEQARRSGPVPYMEGFLPVPADPRYLPTLEELVHIDLEFAWRLQAKDDTRCDGPGSRPPQIEVYLTKFPVLDQPEIVRRLLRQEFHVRHKYGDQPSTEEYGRRFPVLLANPRELESLAESARRRPDQATPFAPGDRIDRYELGREHGRGGFGLVWQAADRKLGREVALKQLNNRFASQEDFRRRFVTEARIAAQLEHPGIVPVYDVGNVDTELPFYTMKFVRGGTLLDAIERFHKLPHSHGARAVEQLRLLNVFLAVTRTMQYAHVQGIIHRDLKPQNIVLGDYGETIILDWGLAKQRSKNELPLDTAVHNVLGDNPQETMPGTVQGTPQYMSPEQAAGCTEEVEERSDIYSLGVILFQILTGQLPYDGRSTAEVLRKVRSAPLPRARTVKAHVPRPLEAICLKAMAKLPEDRYPNAEAFAKDLECYLADEPVSVLRENVMQRLARWRRRHRTLVISSSVACVLLGAAAVGGWIQSERAAHQDQLAQSEMRSTNARHQAELDQREAERNAGIRLSAKTHQQSALSEIHEGRFASASAILDSVFAELPDAAPFEGLRAEIDGQRARVQKLLRFRNLADRTWFLAGEEKYPAARLTCGKAITEMDVDQPGKWWQRMPLEELTETQKSNVAEDVHRLLLLQASLLAMDAVLDLLNPEGIRKCEQALTLLEKAQDYSPTNFSRFVENFCYFRLGQFGKVKPLKSIEPDSPSDFMMFGVVYWYIARFPTNSTSTFVMDMVRKASGGLEFNDPWSKAYRYLRTAAELEPNRYWHHYTLAWFLIEAGDWFHAEMALNACLALDPNEPHVHMARGIVFMREGQALGDQSLTQAGEAAFQKAIQLAPTKPFIIQQRGMTLFQLGRTDEAMGDLIRSGELYPTTEAEEAITDSFVALLQPLIEKNPKQTDLRAFLVLGMLKSGKIDRAEKTAKELIEVDAGNAVGLAVRGTCRMKRGNWADALDDFQKSLDAHRGFLAAIGRAKCLESLKRDSEAVQAYESAVAAAEVNWQLVEAYEGQSRVLERAGRLEDAKRAKEEQQRAARAMELGEI